MLLGQVDQEMRLERGTMEHIGEHSQNGPVLDCAVAKKKHMVRLVHRKHELVPTGVSSRSFGRVPPWETPSGRAYKTGGSCFQSVSS
jgi:hypothetical protein